MSTIRKHLLPNTLAFRYHNPNQDHYNGIMNNWSYGPIFCSPITRRLLLSKYPKLRENVFCLKYNEENTITQEVINFYGVKQ